MFKNQQKSRLTTAQNNALEYVKQSAQQRRSKDLARIEAVLSKTRVEVKAEDVIKAISDTTYLTSNFHPDRLIADGRSVIAALFEDGIYRSQFETKISNGGLTAFAGGDRDKWEEAMLGGAYQAVGVRDAERPKYGGLNLMQYTDGACPRFGSCHLRLKQSILPRATLTFGDSATNPSDIAVIDAFEPVLAGLLERIDIDQNALGTSNVTVTEFVKALVEPNSDEAKTIFAPKQGRALDDYIEAQIHGELNMAEEVDAIVADPSFQGTATGEILEATAKKYSISLEWHAGFELKPSEMSNEFRGSEIPPLAKHIVESHSVDGLHVDAAAIGMAAVSVVASPELWADWGSSKDTLQHIKYIWHTLVVFGKPKRM